jgi:RNA-dependent RNA polymerase
MLYHAEKFDESPRNRNEVFSEACAIYQIVYQYAIRRDKVSMCGFAWKVAGSPSSGTPSRGNAEVT